MGTKLISFARCLTCGWVEPHRPSRTQTCCHRPMEPFTQEVHEATRRKVQNVSPDEMRRHLEDQGA